ncbi:MAG: alpha-ketoglutarate-dependent dioxygenase AlkB [Acidimicrobiales bacterium]
MTTARPDLAIDRDAGVERVHLDDTSWVDVVRGFVREPEALLDELLTGLAWRENRQWRYEVWVTDPRLTAAIPATAVPAAVRQAGLHLDATYRVRFTGPDVLRYRNGRDSVGFHRDRSMRYLDDTLIGIVVLGEPRPFVLRPHAATRDDTTFDVDLSPGRGDLIVMGGRNQADWMHAVPKVDHPSERISLTWRWTSKQGRPDESENYGAARNFGDTGRVGPQRRRSR